MKKTTSTTLRITSNALQSAAGMSPWISQPAQLLANGRSGEVEVSVFNAISPTAIPSEWADEDYRQASMEGTVENLIAWQIRINREERGLTQSKLAAKMGTKQSAISKLEDPDGGDVLVSTLIKAAHAFDCALIVRFVDYGRFASRTKDVGPKHLFACPFSDLTEKAILDNDASFALAP